MRLKITSLVLAFTFLFVLPLVVYAKETSQNRAQNRKDVVAQRKEEFKTRVQAIKDQKKKAAVERINTKIVNQNKAVTNRLSAVLTKLQSVLDRISQKAQDAKAAGKNTAALSTAISNAQTALDAAKAAVSNQAAKEYTLSIANEGTLRSTVGTTVSGFRKDLRDVHKTVVDAKQAVQNALSELAKVSSAKGVNPTASESGK